MQWTIKVQARKHYFKVLSGFPPYTSEAPGLFCWNLKCFPELWGAQVTHFEATKGQTSVCPWQKKTVFLVVILCATPQPRKWCFWAASSNLRRLKRHHGFHTPALLLRLSPPPVCGWAVLRKAGQSLVSTSCGGFCLLWGLVGDGFLTTSFSLLPCWIRSCGRSP